jgi:sugar/nucleoside kinase (ribokinase family)
MTAFCNYHFVRHIKPTLPLSPIDIVNTCGAGDTFCAGLIHSIINPSQQLGLAGGGQPNVSSMLFAMKYAEKSLKSPYAVPASVDLQDLLDSLRK